MESIDRWVNTLNKGQIDNYKNKVVTILKYYKPEEIEEDPSIILNIKEFNTPNKQHTALSAISTYMKFLGKGSSKLSALVTESVRLHRESHMKKEQLVHSFKEIDEQWNKIDEVDEESIGAKLLFDLYIHYPPLRSDILRVKFRNYKQEEPHINLEKKELIIGLCTKTKFEIKNIKLTEVSMNLVKKLLPLRMVGDYLIPMNKQDDKRVTDGGPSKHFHKMSLKYLGIKLSIGDLRKTAVDKVEQETKFLAPSTRMRKFIELGKEMGHGIKTQQDYYNVKEKDLVFIPVSGKIEIIGDFEYCESNGNIIIKGATKMLITNK
jgi:hypothetical protein